MIKIEGFEKKKKLGKFSEEAIGASLSTSGEVTKAEYVKGEDGKAKVSEKGNKQVKITVKATKTEADKTFAQYISATYYETGFSPKLSDIAPKKVGDKEVLKKVSLTFSNGGDGFGSLDVYNIDKGDKTSSGISIFGGNVKVAKKIEGSDSYVVDGYDGNKETLEFGQGIKVNLKGMIEPIEDTETFMIENYDAKKKTIKINMYCFETPKGTKSVPIIFDNIDSDMVKKVINSFKQKENNLVAIMGEYLSLSKPKGTKESKSNDFGGYEAGGIEYDYEAVVRVIYDEEKLSHKIKFFEKTGKLTVEKDLNEAKALNGDKPKDEWVF